MSLLCFQSLAAQSCPLDQNVITRIASVAIRVSKAVITSSGWPFVSAVLGQMAHVVTSITLNSARSCVMQSAFLTQGTVSNIPIVFSWSDIIRPEGFLSSVLLWLVIIGVTVVVVVVESSSVIKL
ncbi:hypothetical protein Tco_1392005 [Tanacetum coccineum]